MNHIHTWQTVPQTGAASHNQENKQLTYEFVQICECGVWRKKNFINEEDKGDAK